MRERGQMRRRLRERKREREARLLDLGALVYELHRQGKRAPELLQEKAAELSVVDQEVRELEAALDGREVVDLNEPEPAAEPADSDETQEADALEVHTEHEVDEPEDAEPGHAEPEDAEPGHAEPEHAEPGDAEPGDDPAAGDEEPRA